MSAHSSSNMYRVRDAIMLVFLAICSKSVSSAKPYCLWPWRSASGSGFGSGDHDEYNYECGYCLSWRMGVESNNIRAWRTVPTQCLRHVEAYMIGGQYQRDLSLIVDNILTYVDTIAPTLARDGLDAWVLDIDDTCISNLIYYQRKRYGCEPFDPMGFKAWASRGGCPAIPDVLRLFNKLVETGFKVFMVSGRDEESLGEATVRNLKAQGYIGYERVILRSAAYRGLGAIAYKSEIRRQLQAGEGYRIWGNVGDQWSDLQGECPGNRTFKIPNPMYFVP